MQAIEKPIFIVAFGANYIGLDYRSKGHGAERSMTCFGDRESAEQFARGYAEQNGLDPAMGRIARYDFSGEVFEV